MAIIIGSGWKFHWLNQLIKETMEDDRPLAETIAARVTPHCFRDTFACDMLTRGVGIFEVAMMLADTVDTVQKHYADLFHPFVTPCKSKSRAASGSKNVADWRSNVARR
jgi:integrase